MTQLTEEQSGRLRQIRERQTRSMRPDRDDVPQRSADPLARALSRELRQVQTDRGFLLSLLDSDSQAAAHRNYECMTGVADETLWCATCAARAEYLRGRSDAATSMRDKCVEKVGSLVEGYKNDLFATDDEDYKASLGFAVDALDKAIRSISPLTLDQQEKL